MSSSLGPVRALTTACASSSAATPSTATATTADITGPAAAAAARGRSASPGQYGSHGYVVRSGGQVRTESHGQRTSTTPLSAWPEAGMPSPRTPRQPHANPELRLSVAVAELQRQAEAERRNMNRQLQQLERRFQEQCTAPTVGRERWADLQGSVSGLLEEMSSLARRVEGLDEKLRLRIGSCEELIRQRTRELEQQLHAQQHKAQLAASTSEEMLKRQTARLRKVSLSVDEHARRLDAMQDANQETDGPGPHGFLQLEARICELDQRQATLEDELRGIASANHAQSASSAEVDPARSSSATPTGASSRSHPASRGDHIDDYDSAIRALEQDMAALAQRNASQLDEHAATLANLRVRSDGHEQRLSAASDRLETAISPPMEALRAEVAQLREHDRQEVESQLEHLSRRVQAVADSSEEAMSELRDHLAEVSSDLGGRLEERPALRKLADASSAQDQALRRLEAMVSDPRHVGAEDFCGVLVRMDSLEHRIDCIEQGCGEQELSEKADRAELLRVDAAVRELSDPLRRLSQRTASGEAKSAALERRIEQLQQLHLSGPVDGTSSSAYASPCAAHEDSAAKGARLDAISKQVADLTARVIEIESLVEGGRGSEDSSLMDRTPRKSLEQRVAQHAGSKTDLCETELQNLSKYVQEQVADLRDKLRHLSSSAPMPQTHQYATESQERHNQLAEGVSAVSARIDEISEELANIVPRLGDLEAHCKSKHDTESSSLPQPPDAMNRHPNEHDFEEVSSNVETVQMKVAEVANHLGELRMRVEHVLEEVSCIGPLHERLDAMTQTVKSTREGEAAIRSELSGVTGSIARLQERLDKVACSAASEHEAAARAQQSTKQASEAMEAVSHVEATCHEAISDVQDSLEKLKIQVHESHRLMATASSLEEAVHQSRERTDSLSKALKQNSSKQEEMEASVATVCKDVAGLKVQVEQIGSTMPQVDMLERALSLSQECHERLGSSETRCQGYDDSLKSSLLEEVAALGTELQQVSNRVPSAEEFAEATANLNAEYAAEALRHTKGEEVTKVLENRFDQLCCDHEELLHIRTFDSDLAERIAEVLQRVASGEHSIATLQKQVEQTMRTLETRLESLHGDHEVKSGSGKPGNELSQALSQALQRIEKGEKAADEMRSQLDDLKVERHQKEPTKHTHQERTDQITEVLKRIASGENDIKTLKASAEEKHAILQKLSVKVDQAVARMEASEAATTAVREELMCSKHVTGTEPNSDVYLGAAGTEDELLVVEVEAQIKELQQQVIEELRCLSSHQQELVHTAAKSSKGNGLVQNMPTALDIEGDLENKVNDLAQQISQEVEELRKHQHDLKQARLAPNGHVPAHGGTHALASPVREHGQTDTVASDHCATRVEAAVQELTQQVADEVKELASHQDHLRQSRSTFQGLSAQISELQRQVELLRGHRAHSDAANGICSPKGISHHARDVTLDLGSHQGNTTEAKNSGVQSKLTSANRTTMKSDASDSYDNDAFCESMDEETASSHSQ